MYTTNCLIQIQQLHTTCHVTGALTLHRQELETSASSVPWVLFPDVGADVEGGDEVWGDVVSQNYSPGTCTSMRPVAGVLPIKGPEKIQLCLSTSALLQRGAE